MKKARKPALKSRRTIQRRRESLEAQYNLMKAALPTDLDPWQYSAACRRIARALGI